MSCSHPKYYLAHAWHFKYTRSSSAGTAMTCSWWIAAHDFVTAMRYFNEYTKNGLNVSMISVHRGGPINLRRSEP